MGMFGNKGAGRFIAGTVGDFLSQLAGMRPTFAPALQAQRERELALQDEQRQLANRFSLWQQQQDYEATHPKAPDPTALERNAAYLDAQQPGLGKTYLSNFANNGGGAPQIMNVPGVGVVALPRNGGTQAPSGPPAAAIDYLRQNPGMAAQFDQKYGAGTSQQYLGGATGQPSRPFR